MSPGAVREVEIRFAGPDRDLAGAVTLPAGDGPFPAAVLVGGSGPLDRDWNHRRLRIDVARQLAGALARAGVASLRYDKRGVGGSRLLRDGRVQPPKAWREGGLHDNADDAAAALTALVRRPDVDPELLFLVGHSEGAVLVAEVAARALAAGHGPRPAGVVLLAGAAEPGDAVLRWQATVLPATLPSPVRAVLRLTRVDVVAKVARNHERIRRTTTDVARLGGAPINARWFREYLDHDPAADLARIDVPLLALTGSKDLQVDPGQLGRIAELVPGPVETVLAPDVSHLLRRQPGPPSLRAYRKEVREPVAPVVVDAVTGWMGRQVERSGTGSRARRRLDGLRGGDPTSSGRPRPGR